MKNSISEPAALSEEQVLSVESQEASAQDALAFLQNVINILSFDCTVSIKEDSENLLLVIEGPEAASLIGYRGAVLDSLQYLTILAANKNNRLGKKLLIDAENYRNKRLQSLEKLAKRISSQVKRSHKAQELEPMTQFERKIVHNAIAKDSKVSSYSEGVDPNRYVVITPNESVSLSFDNEEKNQFKKEGFGKTKSFGGKKRRF